MTQFRRHAITVFSCVCVSALTLFAIHDAPAQTQLSGTQEMTPEMRAKLSQRIDLDLRDASLLEALFNLRDVVGLNLVVGNEVQGTVNASFSGSTVYDILDSLLITRGYGYRVVGGSLAVVPLASLGDQLPLFQTIVIRLEHSQPSDLLPAVESMLSPEGRAHSITSSNSLVLIDYPDRLNKIRLQIVTLEQAASQHKSANLPAPTALGTPSNTIATLQGPQVRIFQPQYVAAATLAEAIKPLLTDEGRVAPVELEDKLVVTDTAENLQRIEIALAQLDLPRPQVRIWALIYDCAIDDVQRLGINWRSGIEGASIDAASGNAAQSAVLDTVTNVLASSPNGVLTMTSLNSYADITGVIQALNSADDSRLLADPNVVVMNHEAAAIEIVTEIPYQQLTQGLEGGTIGTTEFREAGVTLKVTPHIAQDQTISLNVNPKFSLLTGFSPTDNAPIIDRRETSTTVRVTNGQTLVLGGLRQRTRITDRDVIPGLTRIPYLGHLFRHRGNTTRESELLVFITPQIITPCDVGTQREVCIGEMLKSEIEQTPTAPIPFGIDTIRAEDKARHEMIDEQAFRLFRRGGDQAGSCDSGNYSQRTVIPADVMYSSDQPAGTQTRVAELRHIELEGAYKY